MAHFVYDADGQRLLTIQPGDVKVYTPFAEYEETVAGSADADGRPITISTLAAMAG